MMKFWYFNLAKCFWCFFLSFTRKHFDPLRLWDMIFEMDNFVKVVHCQRLQILDLQLCRIPEVCRFPAPLLHHVIGFSPVYWNTVLPNFFVIVCFHSFTSTAKWNWNTVSHRITKVKQHRAMSVTILVTAWEYQLC